MSEKIAFDEDCRWLQSDSQILGRITKEAHDQGTLVTLAMPWGVDFQCVLEKMNAAGASQFCEMVRGEYYERKAEQAAKASRQRFDEREPESVQEGTQGTQEVRSFDPLDVQSIQARYDEAKAEYLTVASSQDTLYTEMSMLLKILEVLDAPKDVEEEPPSVPTAESAEGAGESEVVDTVSRSGEVRALRPEDIGTND